MVESSVVTTSFTRGSTSATFALKSSENAYFDIPVSPEASNG